MYSDKPISEQTIRDLVKLELTDDSASDRIEVKGSILLQSRAYMSRSTFEYRDLDGRHYRALIQNIVRQFESVLVQCLENSRAVESMPEVEIRSHGYKRRE